MASRRPWSALGLSLAAAVLLAGCIGIPMGGGVQTGDLVVSGDGPDIVFTPDSPTPGSDQEQLLQDFMLALRGPQGGYEIARKYLTPAMDATWEPDAVTTIRANDVTITPGGENELLYTYSSRAVVDSTGRYSEQAGFSNQTLSFAFEQVDGEWRISRAPDGIVLSQDNFNIVFRAQPLYFLDPNSEFLVPDVRWFPVRGTILRRVATSLIEGPANWLGGGVVITGFPEGTTLAPSSDSIVIDAGVATVTLSDAASAATPAQRAAMRQQLAATLGVSSVVLKVGPVTLDSPDLGTPPVRPQVAGQVIIGTAEAFGFASGAAVTPIDGLSDQVVAAAASAAVLGRDQRSVAILANGIVSAVTLDDPAAPLDSRPGLVAPSIDPLDFVWSAQAASASSIIAYGLDGSEHPVQTAISADAQVVSMDVSRDGARVLLTVLEPTGPRLYVAGVIRDADNAPFSLSIEYGLDVGLGSMTPIDAAWIDERSVALLASDTDGTEVLSYEVGGPRVALGAIEGGTSIVGGNFGADGIRVLAAGEVWQHRASGWLATGIEARFIATQN